MREIRTSGSVGASESNLRGDPTPTLAGVSSGFSAASFAAGGAAVVLCRIWLWFLWISGFTVLQSSAEAIGFGAGFDDMSAIGDSIDECLAEPSVGDHLGPFGEGQVGGQDDGGFFGPFGHHWNRNSAPTSASGT